MTSIQYWAQFNIEKFNPIWENLRNTWLKKQSLKFKKLVPNNGLGHANTQDSANLFINNITNADGWCDFKNIGCDPSVKASWTISLHYVSEVI